MSSTDQYLVLVDLGTTTLAATLIEVSSGAELAVCGALNPQRAEGCDVVSRLAIAATAEGRGRLRDLVNRALETLVHELCSLAHVTVAQVSRIVVAGNTVMQHLVSGLPIDTLSRPPFRPRDTAAFVVASNTLGWQLDRPLQILPQPGGFVGGDLVAFLFGQGLANPQSLATNPSLYLDLGTNAEIALWVGDRLLTTSAAAGPAFEAGNLSCGMLAQPGAIAGIRVAGERPQLEVIGNIPPRGLCGSGVISTIAALRQAGIISRSGQLLPAVEVSSNLANYLQGSEKDAAFVLYRDASRTLTLTQDDIRQVQLATSAVRAGIEVLLSRLGITAADLGDVVITGSFGAALSPADLETIGLLPAGGAAKSRFVVNGVLAGLIRAVTSPSGMTELDGLASRLQVIPLSGTPLFESLFIEHLNFPV